MKNSKFVRTLFKSMLLWAGLHLVILGIAAIKNRDISLLNIFSILQINLLFPVPVVGLASNIVSGAVVIAVYGLFWIL